MQRARLRLPGDCRTGKAAGSKLRFCNSRGRLRPVCEAAPSGTGEIQGDSIKGGVSKKVSTGDIIHIPAGVPHQFFVDPGKQITYFVLKVAAQ